MRGKSKSIRVSLNWKRFRALKPTLTLHRMVRTTVSKLGAEFWSVELRVPGITMESGKAYELKFRAKSTPARYIYVVPERTDGNQSTLAEGTTLQISEDWTECAIVFHATDSTTSGRLTVSSLSAVPASYWFSGFRLNEK